MDHEYMTPLDMILVVWCNSEILYHHYTQHFNLQIQNNKIQVMLLIPEEVSDFIHPTNLSVTETTFDNIHVRKVSDGDLSSATDEYERNVVCTGVHLETNPLGVRALRLAMNEIHSTPSAYVWIGDWLCDDVDELYQMFVEKFAFDFDTETEMFDHFSMNPCIYYLEWETTNIPGSYWASCVALRSRYPIISGSRGRSPTYERKPFDFSISVSTAQLLAKKSTKSN